MIIFVIVILIILILILLAYAIFMRRQLRSVNRLLDKRLCNQTNQIISIDLFDKELNQLIENINKCLKAEETLRLKVVSEEEDLKKMIANISHDLRTPLTAIKGYVQLLHKNELSKDQRDKVEIVKKHIEELGNLIEHFFEYAYLLDAKPKVTMVQLNLTNLVAECLATAVPMIEEKGLKLIMEERSVIVTADREMTIRIVQNLIRNCIAHAKEEIRVQLREDHGIIMEFANFVDSEEMPDVKRLFDRFYVKDSARKSTGLGLSIVKLLAEQMGGKVSAFVEKHELTIQVYFPNGVVNESNNKK